MNFLFLMLSIFTILGLLNMAFNYKFNHYNFSWQNQIHALTDFVTDAIPPGTFFALAIGTIVVS